MAQRCFHIKDDRVIEVDQVVRGIGEEGVPFERSRPLRGRVRRRDELRDALARCAECGIVERRQILARGTARVRSNVGGVPFAARERTVLVSIGGDEARIHSEAITADQTLSQAGLYDRLEQAPQDVALPEPAVAIA